MADQFNSLARQIERTKAEIAQLRSELESKTGYLTGLEEAYRLVSRAKTATPAGSINTPQDGKPRAGSDVAKCMELIRFAGKPLRIEELLQGIGKDNSKRNRVSLVGSLGTYVRDEKWFTRPAPNTFGLTDIPKMEDASQSEQASLLT